MLGGAQTVGTGEDIQFDIIDGMDLVGTGISVSPDGTQFTFTRPGLYSVEWSLSIGDAGNAVTVCLVEQGELDSPMSKGGTGGSLSSGALVTVTAADLPYTLSLRNYGVPIPLVEPIDAGNSAASIRILRFADGPSV